MIGDWGGGLWRKAIESLPLGVVIFDCDLKIVSANACSRELIFVDDFIHTSLASGTNEKIWGNWKNTFENIIRNGKTYVLDNLSYVHNGAEKILHITAAGLHDEDETVITGGVVVVENMTEKLNAQKQMAHTERLAALGKLASKVAHELNNPIDGIMRYINLARRVAVDEDLQKPAEYLEYAQQGLVRMTHIIAELLEFSRNRHTTLEDASLDKVVDEAIKSVEHIAAANKIVISRNYQPNLPEIKSGAMFQVFYNLLKNAIDAMPDGGNIGVYCTAQPGGAAVIKIQDSGPGFSPANSEAIFEPFFTTKTVGKGTGLGLAICKDIVEKYGGRITAENADNHGSIFTVQLPIDRV